MREPVLRKPQRPQQVKQRKPLRDHELGEAILILIGRGIGWAGRRMGRLFRAHPVVSVWVLVVLGLDSIHSYALMVVAIVVPALVVGYLRGNGSQHLSKMLARWPQVYQWLSSLQGVHFARHNLRAERQLFEATAPHVLPANQMDELPQPVGYSRFSHGWEVVLQLPLGIAPNQVEAKRDEIAHAMGVNRVDITSPFPGQVKLRFYTSDPLHHDVNVPGAPHLAPYELGVYDDGTPMIWDPVLSSHMIVIGQTRSGKSSLLRTLLVSLPPDVEVGICDYKRVEFGSYRPGGKVLCVATSMEDIANLFEEWEADMFTRLDRMVAADVNHASKLPQKVAHRVVMFDEVMAAFGTADVDRKVMGPLVDRTRKCMGQLALLGGAAGYSVVLGLQQPEAQFFGSSGLRDQYRAVIALRHLGGSGVGMAFQGVDVGKVEQMFDVKQGHGVCAGLADTIEPRRFRAHYVDEKDARYLVCGR